MFTTGCCLICLSVRQWCMSYVKQKMFDMMITRAALIRSD